MSGFVMDSARLVARSYRGSPHAVYEDIHRRLLLLCESRRTHGVSINWAALWHFRVSGGEFVGLKNPDFKIVVPISAIKGTPALSALQPRANSGRCRSDDCT